METTLSVPVSKGVAQGKWLLRSTGWALACVVGWLAISAGLARLTGPLEPLRNVLLLGTAGAAHLLVWYKAVLSAPTATDTPEPFWLTTVSALWTLVLLLFQVVCLMLWFIGLILACDTTAGTWN